MPSHASSLKDGSLIYIHMHGTVALREPYEALEAHLQAANLEPGIPILVDLQDIEAFDHDPVDVTKFNLEIDAMLRLFGEESLLLIHAPSALSREMARVMRDSWVDSDIVLVRICQDELGALMILGRHEKTFAELGLTPE